MFDSKVLRATILFYFIILIHYLFTTPAGRQVTGCFLNALPACRGKKSYSYFVDFAQ
jgi:hypothetical protein